MQDSLSEFDDAAADNAALEHVEQQRAAGDGAEIPHPPVAPPEPEPQDENLDALLRDLSGTPEVPEVAAPQEPAAQEPVATPQETVTPEQEPVPYDRFAAINEENRQLKELQHAQNLANLRQQEADAVDPLEGIDPNVASLINRVAAVREKELMQNIAPLVNYANEQLGKQQLEEQVPGYDHVAAQQLYDSMPPEQQARFNNNEMGSIALAALARVQALESGVQAKSGPAPAPVPQASGNPSTAHSVDRSSGIQAPATRPVDVANLPDNQFSKLLEGLKQNAAGTTSAALNVPDSFLD